MFSAGGENNNNDYLFCLFVCLVNLPTDRCIFIHLSKRKNCSCFYLTNREKWKILKSKTKKKFNNFSTITTATTKKRKNGQYIQNQWNNICQQHWNSCKINRTNFTVNVTKGKVCMYVCNFCMKKNVSKNKLMFPMLWLNW